MQGLATTNESTLEIISAYAAPQQGIQAVETTPGWYVVGGFRMPQTARARLELVGAVSGEGLTMRARLFSLKEGAVGPVTGSLVTLNATTTTRALSGAFELTGGQGADYQMQVEVVGGAEDDDYGSLLSLQLMNEDSI